MNNQLREKGVDDIYCLSVNDVFVMKAWLSSYHQGNLLKGIADGNADFAKVMQITFDYSNSFMGLRSKRFALIADNNNILKFFIEDKGQFNISSAEYILNQL